MRFSTTSSRTLTRAELICGMFATGALAACGHTASPAAPKECTEPLSLVGVDEIFSDPVFNDLDKQKLAELFDISASQILALYQQYFAQTAPKPQIDKVIRQIPSAGIAIQSPGTYTLASDLLWTPNKDQSSAIWIQCSDVTLDLGGFTLTASVPDTAWQTTCILVGSANAQFTNVTVKNGALANASEQGILANGICDLNVSHMTVTGLCMNSLATRNLTPAGIKVLNSGDVAISDCSVTHSNVTTDSSAGIFLQNVLGATVSSCTVSSLVNNDGAVQGFGYIGCLNVTTADCAAENLQSYFGINLKTSGHTVLGFCPILCSNISYTDCSASGLTGSCDDCHGMSVFLDGKVTVTRFRADTIVDGPAPYNTGAKATGLEVYGVDVTVTDSIVSNITAHNPQDKQATGFSAWGFKIQFERCQASYVMALDDPSGISQGIGYGWAPDPRWPFDFPAIRVTYTDCKADHCQAGFDTWYHVDSTWLHPVCTNIDPDKWILQETSDATRTLYCDGCSECPTGGWLTPSGGSVKLTNKASGNTIVQ